MAYSPDNRPMSAEEQNAATALERIINNKPFPHGGPGHSQFMNGAKVEIATGYSKYNDNVQEHGEQLAITITDPHAESIPKKTGEFIANALAELPVLKDKIHFHAPKEEARELAEAFDRVVAAGAPVPAALKEWPGFNEEDYQVDKHALGIQRGDWGVTANIRIPKASKVEPEKFSQDLQNRLPQIKEMLAERLSKYTAGDTQKNKAALLAQLNTMVFDVSVREQQWGNEIKLTIRSPQQDAALKAPGGIEAVADKAGLRATNPLSAISDTEKNPQLQKALARSVLNAGNPDPSLIAGVLGREDMNIYLHKVLGKFAEEKPAVKADVDKILNADALKSRGRFGQEDKPEPQSKGTYSIEKSTDPKHRGTVTVNLNLPASLSAQDVINSIGALNTGIAPGHAVTIETPKFAGVDQVQLVGATSVQALQQAATTLTGGAGQTQSVEDALKPLAVQLIASVEQAHNAIANATRQAAAMQQPGKGAPQPLVQPLSISTGQAYPIIR